jgi:hypothetical protein
VLLLQGDLGHETTLDAVALQLQTILVAFATSEAVTFAAVGMLDGQLIACRKRRLLGLTKCGVIPHRHRAVPLRTL